ncbi:sensor histidine kinase [Halogranum rubrum]|nr:HAMP domain-containing sensor histidine kinase [Halogranum salarium]
MSRWMRFRSQMTGALVIVSVGLLLRTVGVAHLYQYALNPFRTFETSLLELVSLTGWASAIVIAGYWFSRRGLRPDQLWRIATWCLVTMGLMTAFVGYILVDVSLGGGWLPDPRFTLLLGANVGAGVGIALGWQRVRAIETAKRRERRETQTELLERQTRVLSHLNRHLRHHVLDTVTVVDGYTDLLSPHIDDDGRRYLTPIRERNARTVDLLANVDALVDALGTPASLVTRDLSLVLHAEVSAARQAHPQATFDVDVPTGVVVRADDLLDIVVANLVQNALVHNESDHPHVSIRLDDDTRVRLTVTDDGPGIPQSVRETFGRVDGVPETTDDTGLGLYLASVVAQRYGSELTFSAEDDGGTAVGFTLQRVAPAPWTTTPSTQLMDRPQPTAGESRRRPAEDDEADSAISSPLQR